ncbi:MAG: hypothetical protein ACREC0_09080 [Methylocella sp.]
MFLKSFCKASYWASALLGLLMRAAMAAFIVTTHSGTCSGLMFLLSDTEGMRMAPQDISSLTDNYFVVQSISPESFPVSIETERSWPEACVTSSPSNHGPAFAPIALESV